jgi:hypothetical protein
VCIKRERELLIYNKRRFGRSFDKLGLVVVELWCEGAIQAYWFVIQEPCDGAPAALS